MPSGTILSVRMLMHTEIGTYLHAFFCDAYESYPSKIFASRRIQECIQQKQHTCGFTFGADDIDPEILSQVSRQFVSRYVRGREPFCEQVCISPEL